jgi:hypothetical protein
MPTVKPHIERQSPGEITEQNCQPSPQIPNQPRVSDEGRWIKIVRPERHNGKNGVLSQTTVGVPGAGSSGIDTICRETGLAVTDIWGKIRLITRSGFMTAIKNR